MASAARIESDEDAARGMLNHAFRNADEAALLDVRFTDIVQSFADYRVALAREAPAGPQRMRREWRCFHCDELFISELNARLHFGRDENSEPACIIKMGAEGSILRALRQAEEAADGAIQAMQAESTDVARAYHAQRARHDQALIAAEELGYERGLADARADAGATQ